MVIKDKGKYNFIYLENKKDLVELVNNFNENYTIFLNNNIIIEISEEFITSEKEILLFLPYIELHQQNNKSFIVVCKSISVDNFPEYFNIVPSLIEGEDVLEFENIQRDLDF